jgi:hypothetical protein
MADNPEAIKSKINDVTGAWTNLRSTKEFAGLTLEGFKAKVKSSLDARAEIEKLELALTAQLDIRDKADQISMSWVNKVVKSVVGDVNEGDDGELYEAMGYIRKSERRTGLTRKKKKPQA